jgi:hypothetical protein
MQDEVTTQTDNKFFETGNSSNVGKKRNKSKFYSERNYEQTEVEESLLRFGAGSFVFQFAIRNYKD